MKVLGALESAQLEWFTDAGKPAASSYVYRVIYVSDLKQVQVSDGTNWVPFLNTSTNQTISGDITFAGQQIFNGLHRLSVTTNSSSGAITALAPTTPATEFTGAVTSISGITSGASGATVMLINRSGSPFTVLDEDTGATAGNRIRTGTGTSISITNNSSVLLTYAGDSRWHVVGGVGAASAGGSKNYFAVSSANPNFSQNSVSPWSACTLTLSSGVPSGAPTLTATQMAIATTGTNPLLVSRSNYNLQLTKSAANAQGQGFISGALTIDREDLAKVLTGSFSYEVVSGTVDFSGQSTQSLEIWVYNTVSGAWTQPAGYRGINQSSGSGIVTFTFQTDSTAANNTYKIAVITAQTSASAYVVNFNDFAIGPTTVINGTPTNDWVDESSLFSVGGDSGATKTIQTKRIGDTLWVRGTITASSPAASAFSIDLPAKYKIDFTKITTTASVQIVGNCTIEASATTAFTAATSGVSQIFADGATQGSVFVGYQYGSNQIVKNNASAFLSAGNRFSFIFQVPVTGWSSNTQISSDTDTRVVTALIQSQASSYSMSAGTAITWGGGAIYDTHGAFNGTTTYTIPVSGYYEIKLSEIAAAANCYFQVYKTGSALNTTGTVCYYGATAGLIVQGSIVDKFNAGDAVTIVPGTATTLNYSATNYRAKWMITRVSGPSVIAATESVNARYNTNAGQTINGASANNIINYGTKVYDSHNAVTTGASWKFTAPISGKYSLKAYNATNNASYAAGERLYMEIWKNGVYDHMFVFTRIQSAITTNFGVIGTSTISLNAGEYIHVNYVTNPNTSLQTAGDLNWVAIERVGN
jgi:hypothetical protein